MRTARRGLIPLLTAFLLLGSCLEPPVLEELQLTFLANGAVVVTSRVEVADTEGTGNPALERRLAAVRQAVARGEDPWTARFATLGPVVERFFWEKLEGRLHRAWRSAVVTDPASLQRFFGDTALNLFYAVEAEAGRAELAIAPGPSTRATRRQRRQVEEALAEWSEAVARYLAAGQRLYAYLEDHPQAARACFGSLFSELLSEQERESLPEPTAPEQALLAPLSEAMEEVFQVLLVIEGEEHTLDELSRLVYDPFPASLVVRLPAPPAEVEGFAMGPDGTLTVPGLGLWEALRLLEGRWLTPDLALLYVRLQRAQAPLHLEGFLSRPRWAAQELLLPSPDEVQAAIEESLTPASLYRAVWAVDPEAEPEIPWGPGPG